MQIMVQECEKKLRSKYKKMNMQCYIEKYVLLSEKKTVKR